MTARRTKRLATVSTGALLLSVLVSSGGPVASADSEIAYDAVGEAVGVEATISNPTIPAGIVIEGSGPKAQARLSSLGTSAAFAALPYPGDTAANLPGTVTALIQVPLPDYPFYIASENGTPPKSASYPGATLSASSTGNRSAAKATAATDAVGYFAETVIGQDSDGSVAVDSTARQNGLDIGGLVTLSNVVSTAHAELDSLGNITTKSSLAVGSFSAPGAKFTVPEQFCIPGQSCQKVPAPFAGIVLSNPQFGMDANGFYVTLPIGGPQKFPIPSQTLFDALKSIGITATYQKEIKTKTSVVAAALSLKTILPSLPDNPGFNGPTPVTYTIGRSAASVSGQITNNDSGTIDIPIGGIDTPLDPGPIGGGTAALPGVGQVPGVTTPGAVPPVVQAPSGSAPNVGTPVLAASTRVPLRSVFWFYLVLVGVGLVGSTAAQVIRYMGVRASWTS